ncbi:MAG: outer membrane beta-barrel protein [Proteobacteria bacterium]|nr:outer membrane beta-barrel protein [Pseudomonadota bacterium]
MKFTKTLLAGSLLLASGLAVAETDWIVRAGFSVVAPDSNNHPIVSVEDATSFTFTLGRMMTQHIELEVLAAWPFEHDIKLVGGPKVGSTQHLPPTVSLNYHFMPEAKFDPYLGAGLNYTFFWDEKTQGALDGTRLSLGDSFGLALQAGVDFNLSNNWLINGSIRYIDLSTKAKLDGLSIGHVNIDPIVYSLNIGKRF